MGLDGMEIIAIAVVIGLFVVVLKQFGIWEPLSLEGKTYKEQVWRSRTAILPKLFFVIWLY